MTKQECENLKAKHQNLIQKVGIHKGSGDRIRILTFAITEQNNDFNIKCNYTHEKSNTGNPLNDDLLFIINTYDFR